MAIQVPLIRSYTAADLPAVFDLYRRLPQQLDDPLLMASLAQFESDMHAGRLYQPLTCYMPSANIAVVAEQDGQIVAFASGGLLERGDFLVENGTAILRLIVGKRQHRDAVRAVIRHVTEHLQGFDPTRIQAFNAAMSPPFFGCLSGMLPSNWNWIAQCLLDEGYTTEFTSLFMVRDFEHDPPQAIPLPDGFLIKEWKTYVMDHAVGIDPKYNVGYGLYEGEEYVGWCGNLYAGAWVQDADYGYVYTNWFTVMDSYKGRGLGRVLLRHGLVEAAALGAKGAILLTTMDNFIAQDLYRSEGYRVVDVGSSFKLG